MQTLQHVGGWISQPLVGGITSIVALLLTFLGYLKIRSIRRSVRKHREALEMILSLHDVYFHLGQALEFLETSPGRGRTRANTEQAQRLLSVCHGLHDSKRSLEMFFELIHGTRIAGPRALLRGASRYRRDGQIERAMIHYEKAIERAKHHPEFPRGDLENCYVWLQRCLLAVWDLEGAMQVARDAEANSIDTCLKEKDIQRSYLILCAAASLRLIVLKSLVPLRPGRDGSLRSIEM